MGFLVDFKRTRLRVPAGDPEQRKGLSGSVLENYRARRGSSDFYCKLSIVAKPIFPYVKSFCIRTETGTITIGVWFLLLFVKIWIKTLHLTGDWRRGPGLVVDSLTSVCTTFCSVTPLW